MDRHAVEFALVCPAMHGTFDRSKGLRALALALIFSGCASPIGIRIASPREVQRYLTRSALTADEPSDFSKNELRQYDLLEAYEKEPVAALAQLRADALAADLPPDALFALAELSFLQADDDEQQSSYAAAVVYAYALLLPEGDRPPLDPLDPRARITADLYNRALTSAFKRTKEGTLALDGSGVVELEFGRITVERSADLLRVNGSELYDLQPVAELEVRGIRNRYRQPGLGAPLAAKTRPIPGVVQPIAVPAAVRLPVTALLLIDSPLAGIRTGDLHGRLEVISGLEGDRVEIAGHSVAVESEPTAALAAGLAESQFWKRELQVFLGNALGVRKDSGLFAIRPYSKTRIPAVFIHGTASSPARWADMVNDLLADARLRERYAFWFFTYDSGNPIAYSGYQLREALTRAVDLADPSATNPCTNDMIVLGHSQGGLLTKLSAIDSGNAFWANASATPLDDLALAPADKELLRKVMFVKPLPFVKEVIFLATPQRGSYLAGPQFVRRLAEYFVRMPSDVARVGADLVTLAPKGATSLSLGRIPTSIDNMSPGNGFIVAISSIPVSPGVVAHSIIAVEDDSPLESAGDGVVKYQSAHVEGVESELIVHSPHSGMQAEPATIEEVRRIFLEHSARSACPLPEN